MRKHLIALAAVWGLATPVWAGELDRDFKGGDVKAPATPARTSPGSVSEPASGTELDDESPTQAWHRRGWGYGGGWGRGYRVGWGGGWGYGYRGWGRGWGYGHGGWYRPYHGYYGGWGYASSYYQPYYASYAVSYYPSYAVSYYPSYGYGAYAYPGGGYYYW